MGTGSAPAPTKRGRPKGAVSDPPAGYIAIEVLRAIKDHAAITDEELAAIMGVSRPTLANILKGKGWYTPPDASRRSALRDMLALHVAKLTEAYNAVKTYGRYKVQLLNLSPDVAVVMRNGFGKAIQIPAKRVVYFEGPLTHVDLTEGEAKALGYAS
jgi:predicted nucleic acid-binding Zn ribbon protein